MNRTLAEQLSEWAWSQHQGSLTREVDHHVRRMVLDHLAGVVASCTGEVSGYVSKFVGRHYGPGGSTGFGLGKTTSLGAAVLNGTNAHGLEVDDGFTPGSFHPTAVVLPAAFAVGQEHGASMNEVIRASAIGMEVGCRIAAVGHPATRRNHFHNTPLAGVFGATTAAALLMNLTPSLAANALGLAGSHASGLFEFLHSSAEVKRYHAGMAAKNGIVSAELAAAGLTGPTTVLEGPEGYFAAYAHGHGHDVEPGRLVDQLGKRWDILNTYFKPYPCCRQIHGPIDAALDIVSRISVGIADIRRITVGTFEMAANLNHVDRDTTLSAQMSLPFGVASAIIDGDVNLLSFTRKRRMRSQVKDLMNKVYIEVDKGAQQAYPDSGRPANVELELVDGTRYSHRVVYPYGEPENPMSDEKLRSKARALTEPVITEAGTEVLIRAAYQEQDSLNFIDNLEYFVERGTGQG